MLEVEDARGVFSVPEVAAILGKSNGHIRALIRSGVLPSTRLGRRGQHLIPRAAIEALLRVEKVTRE